jgi:hypothetical protein
MTIQGVIHWRTFFTSPTFLGNSTALFEPRQPSTLQPNVWALTRAPSALKTDRPTRRGRPINRPQSKEIVSLRSLLPRTRIVQGDGFIGFLVHR